MAAHLKISSVRPLMRAFALACLLAASVPHAVAEECMGVIDLDFDGKIIKGTAPLKKRAPGCGCQESLVSRTRGDKIDGTYITDCRKVEIHMENAEDLRMRTTTINSDGSTNPQGEDSTLIIKRGVMRGEEKDGGYGQFGGEWPDDEYTRRIPRPDMPLIFAGFNTRSNFFSAILKTGANRESDFARMKGYAEKLKARGFTVEAKEWDKTDARYPYYGYRAKNKEGYLVHVTCCATAGINLKKPK